MFSGRRFFCALLPFPEAKTALIRAVYRSDSRLAKAARESGPSMVKSIILKDALSYWNFSNLWSIAGIKKGFGKFGRFMPPFVLKEGRLDDCFPTI